MKAKVLCWFFLFNLLVSLVLANGETKRARLEVLYTQQFELEHLFINSLFLPSISTDVWWMTIKFPPQGSTF